MMTDGMFVGKVIGSKGLAAINLVFPIIMIAQYLLTLGIIFITSAINVYVRDLEYIINFFIQMLFYGTPILYSADMFMGTKIELLVKMNPMATIINSYKDIFYWQNMPHINSLLIVLVLGVIVQQVVLDVQQKTILLEEVAFLPEEEAEAPLEEEVAGVVGNGRVLFTFYSRFLLWF